MSARRLGPGLYSVVLEGRSYEVAVDDGVAYVDGCRVPLEMEDELQRALASVATRGGPAGHTTVTVTAPMPGRIVALPAAAGTKVERGQAIVVLEAMKMESTIAAPSAGTVAELLVQPGQAVTQRQPLVRIEPPSAEQTTATT